MTIIVNLKSIISRRLITRHQANKLCELMRLGIYDHVFLDFSGVKNVSDAFLDQIFNVFQCQHDSIVIDSINASTSTEEKIMQLKAKKSPSDKQ